MKCRCGKEQGVKLSYTEREYCSQCFLQYIEQRVRRDVRLNKDINPLDTIHLYDDGSKEFFAARYFLKNVFGDNLTLVPTKERRVKGKGKLVTPTNMDRELSEKLRNFLRNSNKEKQDILILDNVLEEEIVWVCRVLGREAEKEEEVNMLIERMEEKYPDTKFSLHSAFRKLDRRSSY